MRINDIHFHLDSTQPLKKSVDELKRLLGEEEVENFLVISLQEEPWAYKDFCNEMDRIKNVYYVREVDPTRNYRKDLVEISASNASGIKLHPRLRGFNLESKNVYKAIEKCVNNNLQIIMICSFWDGTWNRYKLEINQFANLADAFPDQKFIWAHAGGHHILDFLFMARRRQNVLLDTSFTQTYYFSGSVFDDLIYSINSAPTKFIFGSDFEKFDYTETLDRLIIKFKEFGLQDDVLGKIMNLNFKKLLHLND